MSHAAEEAPVMGLGVEQRQLLVQGLMSLASIVQQRRYALDRQAWSDERNATRSAERTLRVAEPTVRTMASTPPSSCSATAGVIPSCGATSPSFTGRGARSRRCCAMYPATGSPRSPTRPATSAPSWATTAPIPPLRQTGPDRAAMEALVRDALNAVTADTVMGCGTWPKLARYLQGFTAEGLPVTQMLGALPATRITEADYPASYALRLLERDARRSPCPRPSLRPPRRPLFPPPPAPGRRRRDEHRRVLDGWLGIPPCRSRAPPPAVAAASGGT